MLMGILNKKHRNTITCSREEKKKLNLQFLRITQRSIKDERKENCLL